MINVWRLGHQRGTVASVIVLLTLFGPAAAAAEWRRIDSPNFVVIGDVGAGQLRDVAVKFEGFREVLGRVLGARATGNAIPTVVVVFPHDRAFTPFKPRYAGKPVEGVAGVFYGGRDVNYITLVLDSRPESLRIIFHEYAHLMISNFALNLPLWLDEGLAEYYSTYESTRGGARATIGAAIASHLRLLGERALLPLHELIAVNHGSPLYNERDRRSVFYAQSWALTHMLLLGEPSRHAELATFMRKVATAGTSMADAWQEAFGDDRIERELQSYVRRRVFRAMQFDFAEKLAQFEAKPVVLPQPDVQSFLAALYLRQGQSDSADKLIAVALGTAAGHPHANAVRAQRELEEGGEASAGKRLTAIDAGSDWFAAYLAGVALTGLAERSRGGAPAEYIAGARRHFEVVNRRSEIANVLARQVALDMVSAEGPAQETLKLMERVRGLAPGRDDFAFQHARLLARLRLFPAARAALGPMMVPAAPPHVRSAARSLMEYVVELEQRTHKEAERSQPSGTSAAPADRDPVSASPPSRVIYDFRRLQAGEHRLEGVLERIDCPRGGGATFHVRSGSTLTTLQAKVLGDVDFIAYRDDLKGNVGCGPLGEPMAVYVTWRPGAQANDKLVVAVEFLPKSN